MEGVDGIQAAQVRKANEGKGNQDTQVDFPEKKTSGLCVRIICCGFVFLSNDSHQSPADYRIRENQ